MQFCTSTNLTNDVYVHFYTSTNFFKRHICTFLHVYKLSKRRVRAFRHVYKLFEMTFTCQFARLQTFLVYVFVSFCTSTNLSTLRIRVILRVYKLCDITTRINFLHRWYRLRFSNDASLDFPPKRRSIRSSFSWTPPSLWWFRIVPGILTTFPLFLCPFSYNE